MVQSNPLHERYPDPEIRAAVARRLMRAWLKESPGRDLVAAEQHELERVLPDLFGYHLVQLGGNRGREFCSASRILNRHVVEGPGTEDEGHADLFADPRAVPLETGSVDVVVLPHTLDLEPDPWAILAEAERVLVPEGRLVVLGINPWSSWGVYKFIQVMGGDPLWNSIFLSQSRIGHWLGELDLHLEDNHGFFYRPPINDPRWMERLMVLEDAACAGLPLPAGIYLLVAVKRVATLTPVKPAWHRRLSPSRVGVFKPSTGFGKVS